MDSYLVEWDVAMAMPELSFVIFSTEYKCNVLSIHHMAVETTDVIIVSIFRNPNEVCT